MAAPLASRLPSYPPKSCLEISAIIRPDRVQVVVTYLMVSGTLLKLLQAKVVAMPVLAAPLLDTPPTK